MPFIYCERRMPTFGEETAVVFKLCGFDYRTVNSTVPGQ